MLMAETVTEEEAMEWMEVHNNDAEGARQRSTTKTVA